MHTLKIIISYENSSNTTTANVTQLEKKMSDSCLQVCLLFNQMFQWIMLNFCLDSSSSIAMEQFRVAIRNHCSVGSLSVKSDVKELPRRVLVTNNWSISMTVIQWYYFFCQEYLLKILWQGILLHLLNKKSICIKFIYLNCTCSVPKLQIIIMVAIN